MINRQIIELADNAGWLGLIMNDKLRLKHCIAYGAMQLLYPHSSCLPIDKKKIM